MSTEPRTSFPTWAVVVVVGALFGAIGTGGMALFAQHDQVVRLDERVKVLESASMTAATTAERLARLEQKLDGVTAALVELKDDVKGRRAPASR